MTDPEKLLDSVLRGYSDVEPRAGWEQRIIARASRPRAGMWLFFIPGFAVAMIVVISFYRPQPAHPSPIQIVKVEYKSAPPAPLVVRMERPPVLRARQTLPKLAVFPMAVPLTVEERALLGIAASADHDMFHIADPSPIHIEPIQIDALEKEN